MTKMSHFFFSSMINAISGKDLILDITWSCDIT